VVNTVVVFCPKCGAIVLPKKDKNKIVFRCSCGYVHKDKEEKKLVISEKKFPDEEVHLEVVKHDEDDILPVMKIKCPQCGNPEAYYWLVQTRSSDEPETKFLKCTKCKHQWRDYE